MVVVQPVETAENVQESDVNKTGRNVSRSPYDSSSDWKRARGILARSLYKELKSNGLNARQIVELSNEILRLVAGDFRRGDRAW